MKAAKVTLDNYGRIVILATRPRLGAWWRPDVAHHRTTRSRIRSTLLRERHNFDLSREDVIVLLAALVRGARRHDVYYLWRHDVRDPGDAHVLEAAVAAGCPRLVSFNRKDFPGASSRGVRVLRPGRLLSELRQAGVIE